MENNLDIDVVDNHTTIQKSMVLGFSKTWVQIQDFLSLCSQKSCLKSLSLGILLSMRNKDATLGGLF